MNYIECLLAHQLIDFVIQLRERLGQIDPRKIESLEYQDKESVCSNKLYCEVVHVSDRPSHCQRKTASFRPSTYETHSVASKSKLTCTRVSRKATPSSKVASQAPRAVATGRKCLGRPAPESALGKNLLTHHMEVGVLT